MRGRTNITPVKNPYVKGDLVQAVVETGNTIETGDFVEVVYQSQRTQKIDQSRMTKYPFTSGTDALTSNIGSYSPTYFEMQNGYVCLIYINNVPTVYFVKEENGDIVFKDSITWAKDRGDQNICKLGDNLFAIVKSQTSNTCSVSLYKIQNDAIVLITSLSDISTQCTSQGNTFLSICKLNSSQLVLFMKNTTSSMTATSQSCSLYYYILDFTDTTITNSSSLKSVASSSFTRYNEHTESFIFVTNNKLLFAFNALSLWEFTNTNGTIAKSREFTQNTRSNVVTYDGRFLVNEGTRLISMATSSYSVARYILDDTSITYNALAYKTGATIAQGQTISKISDNTFIATYWDDYYQTMAFQVFIIDKTTGNLTASNKVTFQPISKYSGSGTLNYLLIPVFGLFLKFGNNIYYLYGDAEVLTSSPTYHIYYQKIGYDSSGNLISLGQETNKVKLYSTNGFAMGFAKTGGNAGDTITVYKPHSNS